MLSLPNVCPPFAGRSSFPVVKGAEERVGVFKAKQEGGFVQLEGALFEIMTRKFTARLFHNLLKGDTRVSKPALKRTCAQAEFLSDIPQRRTLSSQ